MLCDETVKGYKNARSILDLHVCIVDGMARRNMFWMHQTRTDEYNCKLPVIRVTYARTNELNTTVQWPLHSLFCDVFILSRLPGRRFFRGNTFDVLKTCHCR